MFQILIRSNFNNLRKYNTTTLWELSKLVKDEFKVHLSDTSIYNILHKFVSFFFLVGVMR